MYKHMYMYMHIYMYTYKYIHISLKPYSVHIIYKWPARLFQTFPGSSLDHAHTLAALIAMK